MTTDRQGGIFLSYRREEAGYAAGRLADRIAARFPDTRVFIDVDSIPPGEDFVEAIRRAVAGCDVLLALIGREWTAMTDEQGRRRLDSHEDFVVLEIEEALERDVHVVPVLLDGAAPPRPEELPAALRPLSRCNAVRVDAESFRRDSAELLTSRALLLPADRRPGAPFSRRRLLTAAVGVAAVSVVGAGTWAVQRLLDSPLLPRWVFPTGGQVFSGPTVSDGTLYVGSRDRHLYALDAGTGEERWRYRTGAAVTSTPAVADGRVYVGSNDTRVHAVDAGTGRASWTFPTGGALHSSPAVAGGTVFIGSRDNHVYALDAASGELRWRFAGEPHDDLVTGFNSSPVVADGVVYIGCRDFNIYAIDAEHGFQRWRRTTGSTVDSSGAVVPGTLLIGSDDQSLWAVSTDDGSVRWTFPTGGGVVSKPRVDGDVVFVGSGDGHLYAVDLNTGRQRWRMPTGGAIRSSPTSGLGLVYVGSSDFRVYAADVQTGEGRWSFATFGPVDDSSPALDGDTVYVGSLDHRVYALDALRGAEENVPR